MIHPSAFVHPKAKIGKDVEIGPFAYVGEHAVIGDRSKLEHHACVEGHTTMGVENEVGPFAVLGGRPQDLKYKNEPTQLIVGNRNKFREYVTLNTGTVTGTGLTKIGSDCLVMAYCHVAHDCVVGNNVIMANYTGLSGHVVIEDHVIVSGMCGISQFLRLGKHAFIGGMTSIRKDVAPYTIVVGDPSEVKGVNRVGLKRRGYDAERMDAVVEAHRIYFDKNLEKDQALQEIESKYPTQEDVQYFVRFVRASENGIGR